MTIFDWSRAVPQNICPGKTGIFYLFFQHDLNVRIPTPTARENVQLVIVMHDMRLYVISFDLGIVCFIIFSLSLLMFDKSPTVYFSLYCLSTDIKVLVRILKILL